MCESVAAEVSGGRRLLPLMRTRRSDRARQCPLCDTPRGLRRRLVLSLWSQRIRVFGGRTVPCSVGSTSTSGITGRVRCARGTHRFA